MFTPKRSWSILVIMILIGLCIPSLAIAQPRSDNAEPTVNDLCNFFLKSIIIKDYNRACRYASQAIQKGGNSVCQGQARKLLQTSECEMTAVQPQQPNSGILSDPSASPAHEEFKNYDIKKTCQALSKAKKKNDNALACALSKHAIKTSGSSACKGAARKMLASTKCTPAPPNAELVVSESSTLGMSIDDVCSLAVKAKLDKNPMKTCLYYARAKNMGGDEACRGNASITLETDNCKTLLKTKETELCKQLKKAKQKASICQSAEEAYQIFGEKACKGRAKKAIKTNKCQ